MIVVSDNEVSQNLAIEASTPQLGTSAADQSDGDRTLDARGGTIVDTVTYTGLTPGVEYTIKGELVTPEGTPLNITGETTFTPTTTNGTVTVTFTVPAGHDGTSLVAFERAYDAQGLVATHEDPTDPAQTITVSPKEKAKKSSLAATGLDSDLLPLAGLLAMAGATAFISRRKLMRK
jgi:LPXTG-motif cell wall-anchored protein